MLTTLKFRTIVLLLGISWLAGCAGMPTADPASQPAEKPAAQTIPDKSEPAVTRVEPSVTKLTRAPRWKQWLPKPDVSPRRDLSTTASTPSKKAAPKTTDQHKPSSKPAPPSKQIVVAVAKPQQTKPRLQDKVTADLKSLVTTEIYNTCKRIDWKLDNVSLKDCLAVGLTTTGFESSKKVPILIREYFPTEGRKPMGRVLLLGGTHGDELTSITSVFKWMLTLNKHHTGLFHWHVAPMLNPDGALLRRAKRTNGNGVDLNRNLPTSDWHAKTKDYWVRVTGKNPRRYPGPAPASEPETKWLIQEIENFKPDVIISVHAPIGMVDFDAPNRSNAPYRIGMLHRNLLRTYPGSLGNYAGIELKIPVITLELRHAWTMPTPNQLSHIWLDLISWLKHNLGKEGGILTADKASQSLPAAN